MADKEKQDAWEVLCGIYEECGKAAVEKSRKEAETRKLIREVAFLRTHQR